MIPTSRRKRALSLAENHLARRVMTRRNALDQVAQFGLGESGEDRHLCQDLGVIRMGSRHAAHYTL
jgi:hypothetical protein